MTYVVFLVPREICGAPVRLFAIDAVMASDLFSNFREYG